MTARVEAMNNESASLLRCLADLIAAGQFELVETEAEQVYHAGVWDHDSPRPRPFVRYTVRVTVREELQLGGRS